MSGSRSSRIIDELISYMEEARAKMGVFMKRQTRMASGKRVKKRRASKMKRIAGMIRWTGRRSKTT